ncbi:MAG: hypothetical protein ACK55Z_14905, partial [bacterium]
CSFCSYVLSKRKRSSCVGLVPRRHLQVNFELALVAKLVVLAVHLPKPATESHVVSRGTPVAPCRPKAQGKRITRVGSPHSPEFPKYHELFDQPHHCKAVGNSLTAKGREHT